VGRHPRARPQCACFLVAREREGES
jgi:hypothetical protein